MATHGISAMKRHEEYYFRDGNVCFLVEGTTFRLHRHFFERESAYFREKLGPATEGEDGSSSSPYIIHDVKIDEFAQFVWVWYNPSYSFSRKGKDQWLTILKLATQWEFPEIRNLAIRQLERLNLQPIEKIALYKQYKVNHNLLLPSYMLLCRNGKLPSHEEGKRLSLDTVLRIASAREKILLTAMESGCKTPTTASTPDDVTKAIIADFFDLTPLPNDQDVRVEGQAVNYGTSGNAMVDRETITVKPPKKGKSAEPSTQNVPSQNGVTATFPGKGKNKAP